MAFEKNLPGAVATLTGGWIGDWQVKRDQATVMVAIADTHLDGQFGYDPSGASYTLSEQFDMSRFEADDIIDLISHYIIGGYDD